MIKLSLNGVWKMQADNQEKSIQAKVPGSVMHSLLENNLIEDPFYRDNEEQAYDIASADYTFSRQFAINETMLSSDNILLRCEGLDTLAEITVNGKVIAFSSNMHRTYEFDVKPALQAGTNEIEIKLLSPTRYIKERHERQPLNGVEHALEGYQYIRKAHSMLGWDWGPQIPDQGIWRDISIVAWNKTRIDDVMVKQSHNPDGSVKVDLAVKLDNPGETDTAIHTALTSPDGIRTEESQNISGNHAFFSFAVDEPDLWWPNGYGEQPLYLLEIEMEIEGEQSEKEQLKIGLRTISIRHEPDQWGKSFEFVINGVSIFAMGANYIPEDSLLPRVNRDRTERLIQDCTAANFNMIRVWGGGYYPDDFFYDLCDEYGLIVWQDFMFACSVYDVDKSFEENVREEAIDNIKRLRHHASLGLWCGNNEVEAGWEGWGWPERSKFRSHYVKLFEVILPKLVEELDPQTFYWPSSPSSGGAFDRPDAPNEGDVHYWDVWHGLKPFTEYRKFLFRFCSEFGFQSFPSHKTVESFTKPEDRNVFSYVMEKHQKNGGANGKILTYLSDTFLYPRDFKSLLYVSQLLQAEAIKYGVEHWRRNRGICMGSIYWQLNDCWPVASWSSLDYYGRWKALHYFARKFYAPVLLSIKEDGFNAELHVTNDTRQPVQAEVRWRLCDRTGKILQSGKRSVEIPPLSAFLCESLSFADILDKNTARETYLEASIHDGSHEVSVTSLFTKPKHFRFSAPNIKLLVQDELDQYRIELTTDSFAKYVELDLQEADCIFSDNFFDLSAGKKKVIHVEKDSLSKEMDTALFRNQLTVRSLYDTVDISEPKGHPVI